MGSIRLSLQSSSCVTVPGAVRTEKSNEGPSLCIKCPAILHDVEGLAGPPGVRESAMDDAVADTMALTRNRRGLFKYGMQVLNTLIPQIRSWYKTNPAAQKRIRIIAKELKPLIAMTLPKILEFYAKTPVLRKLIKKVMERVDKLKLREKLDMSGFNSIKKEVMKIKDETK